MSPHEDLIEAYLDDELDPSQEARFCDWLSADPEHVSHFVREVHLHQSLRMEMQASLAQASATATERPWTSFEKIGAGVKRLVLGWRPAWTISSGLTACGALLVGLGFWCFGPTMGQPVLARVAGIDSFIQRGTQFVPAAGGMALQATDVLRLGTNASATIAFGAEKTRLELSAGTELRMASLPRGKHFELKSGRLEATVARQRPFRPMVISTPQAEARVLGTRFTLSVTTNATRMEVVEGKVRFTRAGDGLAVKVPAGNYAVAAVNYELITQPLTGRVLREYWTNLPGEYYVTFLTSTPGFPDHPSGREYLDKFEAPSHWGRNYGARIRGYLHPPTTGPYTFWVTSADGAELFLSSDENPNDKQQIASSVDMAPGEWTKLPRQQSSSVNLVAGRRYYVEVLHKQGDKDDHLAVAWQKPGHEREIIPGEFLSPFKAESKENK